MKVDWMILANAAEVQSGLLYMVGGCWDTITPGGRAPAGEPVAAIRGSLVCRLLMNRSETGRPHTFELRFLDADGQDIASSVNGQLESALTPGLPQGWDQGTLLSVDMTNLPLPKFGIYELPLSVDGNFLASISFRVVEPG